METMVKTTLRVRAHLEMLSDFSAVVFVNDVPIGIINITEADLDET